jgi:hypothetical protein
MILYKIKKLVKEEINNIFLNEYSYSELSVEKDTWIINGEEVGIPFFVHKYDEWNNQGGENSGYKDPSHESVFEFLQNNYEDFIHDEKLKKELFWALTDRNILDEAEVKMSNVIYTAIVLDDKSHAALLSRLGNMIPEGWETLAYHMTINLGPIAPEFQKFLGMTVNLIAIDFATDDKVMAVGVEGFGSRNSKPHITLAVNRANGGKPMMSNKLTEWQKLSEPLSLTGKITEIR